MLTIKTTKRFTKSLKILVRIPKKRAKIQHVIQQLQEHSKLEAQHKDHKLVGNFNGCRECHIEFDRECLWNCVKMDLDMCQPIREANVQLRKCKCPIL